MEELRVFMWIDTHAHGKQTNPKPGNESAFESESESKPASQFLCSVLYQTHEKSSQLSKCIASFFLHSTAKGIRGYDVV